MREVLECIKKNKSDWLSIRPEESKIVLAGKGSKDFSIDLEGWPHITCLFFEYNYIPVSLKVREGKQENFVYYPEEGRWVYEDGGEKDSAEIQIILNALKSFETDKRLNEFLEEVYEINGEIKGFFDEEEEF